MDFKVGDRVFINFKFNGHTLPEGIITDIRYHLETIKAYCITLDYPIGPGGQRHHESNTHHKEFCGIEDGVFIYCTKSYLVPAGKSAPVLFGSKN